MKTPKMVIKSKISKNLDLPKHWEVKKMGEVYHPTRLGTPIDVIQNMLGFKNFESAERTLSGIEVVSVIKKNQLTIPMASTYHSFCSLAA